MVLAHDYFGDGSVLVVDVPLACCAIESQSVVAGSEELAPEISGRIVVTISGTITRAVAPAITALIDSLPKPPVVVAFGACACVGGPYWDSYSVVPGAAELGIEVHHWVPGCPPPPEALEPVLAEVRRG